MEGLIILLVIVFVFAPIVLGIVSIVKVSNIRSEFDVLKAEIRSLKKQGASAVAEPPPRKAQMHAEPTPLAGPEAWPIDETSQEVPAPAVDPLSPAHRAEKVPDRSFEFAVGGKAAAFAGALIVVAGIAFLIAYAMQNAWLGPVARTVIGLIAGALLTGMGCFLARKKLASKYAWLAYSLMGGGCAVFYFSVFAAYALRSLISGPVAGAGLFFSAAAAFGLAMVYRSQVIGVLGVLGAFVTPVLIDSGAAPVIFVLIYAAAVNVPVVLLGVRRNWQALYNVSFGFLVFYYLYWVFGISSNEVWAGLVIATVYYLQFAALGLLKLRTEQEVLGRRIDQIRLLLNAAFYLGAVYLTLQESNHEKWQGTAFVLAGLLQFAVSAVCYRKLQAYTEDFFAFLAGAILAVVLAVPAQLDGVWVTLFWSAEGVVLSWYAVRVNYRKLSAAAAIVSLIGIFKALFYDVEFYTVDSRLFLNAHFLVGASACMLMMLQGVITSRLRSDADGEYVLGWEDVLWWVAVLGGLGVFIVDIHESIGFRDEYAWVMVAGVTLILATVVAFCAKGIYTLALLSRVLMIAVPLQIVVFYLSLIAGHGFQRVWTPMLGVIPWVMSGLLFMLNLLAMPLLRDDGMPGKLNGHAFGRLLNVVSILSVIFLMTAELHRLDSDWSGALITILWAVSALVLISLGFLRLNAAYRKLGLVLFGLSAGKVVLIDSAALSGLERIIAFLGSGILLLIVSFVYMRAASHFLEKDKSLTGERS